MSSVTHCICTIQPNLSVVDVKEGGEKITVKLAAVERVWRRADISSTSSITYCICKIKRNLRVLDVKEGGGTITVKSAAVERVWRAGVGYQLDELDLIRYPPYPQNPAYYE
jgi:uncharacterized protein YodC (DUF2158 family)